MSGLEQAMTGAIKSRLDKLVAAKLISAAQERQMLSRLSAQVAQQVNRKGLPGPRPNLRWGFGRNPGRTPAPPAQPGQVVPPAYVPAPAYPAPTA